MERKNLATIRAGYREVRRITKYGPTYPWRRYIGPAGILKSRTIQTDRSGDVSVCVLTCRKDWLSCLWSLVSFYELSGLRLPLLIYSDGTLSERHFRELAAVFPEATIVRSNAGEKIVTDRLSSYPNCLRFRTLQPYARKLIDLPILCGSPLMLILDSDVFFVKRPQELMMHLELKDSKRFVFERDPQEAYFASRADIEERFGVSIASRVNVGIVVADVTGFDYSRIEQWLGQDSVASHPWAEQTLWAMYAGQEQTVLLGEGYDVTEEAHIEPKTVAKHYIRPIRDYLYMEGIPHLRHLLDKKNGKR